MNQRGRDGHWRGLADNREMPGPDKEAVTIEPWAFGIGLGTLVLVASVAAFTAWDRTHTASLEEVITETAVGDTHFIQEPKGRTGPIGLKYQGQNLDMVSENKIRDSKLIRVGADDSGVYSVYRLEEEKEGSKNERLFMKAGANEFVEVTEE
jgi:hypothetical protein